MSLNDAIDVIEEIQKLMKKATKSENDAEKQQIKKCWAALEDLAKEEQTRAEGAEAAFIVGKERKIKHCKVIDDYSVIITIIGGEMLSLKDAKDIKKGLLKRSPKWGLVSNIDIVRDAVV